MRGANYISQCRQCGSMCPRHTPGHFLTGAMSYRHFYITRQQSGSADAARTQAPQKYAPESQNYPPQTAAMTVTATYLQVAECPYHPYLNRWQMAHRQQLRSNRSIFDAKSGQMYIFLVRLA